MNLLLAYVIDWEQFFGLFNYWVVIFLMMTGFYILIARENLIKTIIGLNIFQTSVFLLYITMGKVKGGTTPIIPPDKVESHHGDEHGEHAGEHGEHARAIFESGNEHTGHVESAAQTIQPTSFDEEAAHGAHAGTNAIHETAEHLGSTSLEQMGGPFSNPLPSVLMLTAIVVGIATTALALALIVRIREDYGTIEEDEILEIDRNDPNYVRESSFARRSKDRKEKSESS
jgi:multicomponent Na+:H+ antiporter subunit C